MDAAKPCGGVRKSVVSTVSLPFRGDEDVIPLPRSGRPVVEVGAEDDEGVGRRARERARPSVAGAGRSVVPSRRGVPGVVLLRAPFRGVLALAGVAASRGAVGKRSVGERLAAIGERGRRVFAGLGPTVLRQGDELRSAAPRIPKRAHGRDEEEQADEPRARKTSHPNTLHRTRPRAGTADVRSGRNFAFDAESRQGPPGPETWFVLAALAGIPQIRRHPYATGAPMKTVRFVSASTLTAVALSLGVVVPACGSSNPPVGFGSDSGAGSGSGSGSGGGGGSSSGISGGSGSGGIFVPPSGDGGTTTTSSCPGGGTTTISGTIYDPAKKNPLYNVVAYVPGSTPSALTTGASCDSCDSLYTGNPVATALTDTSGKFTIKDAPAGTNVPLVLQIGKWRKQLTIPTVTACQDNPQADKSLSLPTKSSEGDIPSIAVSTGGADSLECLLSRIGLDPSEYTGGASGTGHIHIFEGSQVSAAGATLVPPQMAPAASSSASLWDSQADLMKYDIVLLSCEGAETGSMNQAALQQYTTAGGRVFASHYHYAWLNTGPFGADNLATWTTDPTASALTTTDLSEILSGSIDAVIDQTLPGGGTFYKGQALDTWLRVVGGLETTGHPGDLSIAQARHNADVAAANTYSQSWIHADSDTSSPNATQYFSFNTPVDAGLDDAGDPAYCGRVVYSDLHVGGVAGLIGATGADYGGSYPWTNATVPTGCAARDLSPQEKALEFMLFDLSSCVVSDSKPPPPRRRRTRPSRRKRVWGERRRDRTTWRRDPTTCRRAPTTFRRDRITWRRDRITWRRDWITWRRARTTCRRARTTYERVLTRSQSDRTTFRPERTLTSAVMGLGAR